MKLFLKNTAVFKVCIFNYQSTNDVLKPLAAKITDVRIQVVIVAASAMYTRLKAIFVRGLKKNVLLSMNFLNIKI